MEGFIYSNAVSPCSNTRVIMQLYSIDTDHDLMYKQGTAHSIISEGEQCQFNLWTPVKD